MVAASPSFASLADSAAPPHAAQAMTPASPHPRIDMIHMYRAGLVRANPHESRVFCTDNFFSWFGAVMRVGSEPVRQPRGGPCVFWHILQCASDLSSISFWEVRRDVQ